MSQSSSLVIIADRFRLDSELLASQISTVALAESSSPRDLADIDLTRVDLVVLDAECDQSIFDDACARAAAVGLMYDHESGLLRQRMRAAPVRLVLPRSAGLSDWRTSIENVLEGRSSVEMTGQFRPVDSQPTLSPRETEILRLMAGGLGNGAIASALEISPHTVRTHVQAVLTKLNKSSRVAAVGAARQSGLLR
jgi:DNA-binding NarL/FixJ family response regulator